MYNCFEYKNACSNPYITMNSAAFWRMLKKYEVKQCAPNTFEVIEHRQPDAADTYHGKKDILHNFAIDWQNNFDKMDYSYSDIADYGAFFEEYGRKYGLLREFKEAAIY